jgi:hypothetical protein
MTSEVDIANRALSKLGEIRITSLSDNNKAARAMQARYSLLRDAELAASAWGFAVRRVLLAASTDVPAWGYARIFNRPVDDIRPLMVGDLPVNVRAVDVMFAAGPVRGDRPDWQIVENRIQTDLAAPLKYEYIARVTDSGVFDPLFVEVLACRLAADACEEITQSNTKQEAMLFQYREALSVARRTHALWEPPRRKGPTRFMMARGY